MTDLEKIAAILTSNLDDALKLELAGLVAGRERSVAYPIYTFYSHSAYPTVPSLPTYPTYPPLPMSPGPTWTCTTDTVGTTDPALGNVGEND